ncbi:MAG: glutamate--tRNA ligase family protein [bacterium]|nr:glutamate--tRNA ligase family protein [bacterium]
MTHVVTRIPPSPTGRLHIGTARTALFNYLFARHHGGTIIFRSEDTDRARSKKEYEDEILEGLSWLGLSWDEFSRQSEHATRHQELLEKLVGEGKAYVSKEPAYEDPHKTVEVVRLKNPGRSVTFHDEVRDNVTFDTTELGDFVIARAIDDPLYHFAVVVDDMDALVTHVIRGEDHVSNTCRQILIQEALGAPRPIYAHLPLILDASRAKLSKRSGATSVMDYRAEGFLPEALVNYIALLGWSPGSNREDFSLAELVETFSLEGIQKSGAAWNRDKLLSVNHHWMRKLSDTDFLSYIVDTACPPATGGHAVSTDHIRKAVPLLKERATTFGEARQMLSNELGFFFAAPSPSRETLLAKELSDRPGIAKSGLEAVLKAIKGLSNDAPAEAVRGVLMPIADKEEVVGKGGRGAVLWPLRYALSGQERSPDPFTIISILGKEESLRRLQTAIAILG